MFGECQNIDEAIKYARSLQAGACCYGTKQGDGRFCDCKFLSGEKFSGGEQTGCCEARALVIFLEKKKAQETITLGSLREAVVPALKPKLMKSSCSGCCQCLRR
jgi:hypothetical protein